MRRALILVLALFCSSFATSATAQARPAPKRISASKIILVGDSTTAVQSGWGPSFCAHHVTSALTCTNLARGGRSTYSYRAEGSWDIALAEMRSGHYTKVWVLVQFGHNDQPGKPGRSTDLEREFPANLLAYIDEIRAAGAIPVLVTPLTRRQFKAGVLQDDLAPWAARVREVAAQRDVALVDLHARSRMLVQGMGPVLSQRLAQQAPTSLQIRSAQADGDSLDNTLLVADTTPASAVPVPQLMATPKRAFDHTHLGQEGADLFSAIVADELARDLPDLAGLLIP